MGRHLFKLPDVGEGVAEAEIVAWHVEAGDSIETDQPLVDVMTDKATVEITSPVSGRVISLEFEAGALAAIGSVLAVMEVEGATDDGSVRLAPSPPPSQGQPSPSEAPVPAAPAPAREAPPVGMRPLASPAVRRRAAELGIDLARVAGTGPAGRIGRNDLEASVGGAPQGQRARLGARSGVQEIKLIGLRRRIAERMAQAKRKIPHFSYVEEVDVTELERLRQELNGAGHERPKLTLLAFLARALARVLPSFPEINATLDDAAEVLTQHCAVHLGVAVQTDAGLMVAVVRHAEARDLWDVAAEIKRLADAARSGKASREELAGSTITVTSLGALGGLATTPVINSPEVAIVGPNRIVERPVVAGGAIVIRKMMNLSCSFDHRVVDGWRAAEFVQGLKKLLECPALMFVDEA